MAIQKIVKKKTGTGNPSVYVGTSGEVFLDDSLPDLRLSDGSTPGGLSLSAATSGISTYSSVAGYATSSGISTYSSIAGYSTSSGISTYSPLSGFSTYSTTAGISTVSQGLTGTPNITVARVGISSYLSVSGVTSFYNDVHFEYDRYVLIGNDNELQLFHNGSNSYIDNSSTNNLIIRTHGGSIQLDKEGPELMGVFNTDGSVELYYNNSKKFETTSIGATVFGTFVSSQLNISGVTTSSGGFVGNLTGTATTATTAGYASTSGIATYATSSGVATYSGTSGIATYATSSGIATIAGYATTAGIATVSRGLTGTPNINVGVVTATYFVGDGSLLTNVPGSANSGYANTAGIATYAQTAGIATYSGTSGVSTYAQTAGIATYSGTSGVSTYAQTAGIATIAGYASTSGIATVAQGLTGIPDINVGIVTATSTVIGAGVTIQQTGIRATGIITANSFRPSSGYYQSANGTNSFYVYDGTGNVAFQGTIGVNQINSGSGYKALEFSAETTPVVMVTNGMNVTGVTTSSGGFVGNLTGTATTATTAGYATTSGISTVAQGLTGTPNINVGVITATISIPTQLRTRSVAEKTTLISGNTVGLAFTTGGGNVAICTNPSGDITLNVTDIPTDSTFDNHSISFSVIVNQTGTARTCTTITLNGVSRTIRWAGGSLANAISGVTTSTGFDIFTFTGINTVGSASTTSNYVVLGSVNGGFN